MQPHSEVKSFPSEPINPLISNSDGTYIVGGGVSGDIYLWEVNNLFIHLCSCFIFPDLAIDNENSFEFTLTMDFCMLYVGSDWKTA